MIKSLLIMSEVKQEEKQHNSNKKDHTKIWAVVVLVISAIVFIPVGGVAVFESFFSNRDVPVFGTYQGKKIEYKQGSRFNNQLQTLRKSYENRGYNINAQAQFTIFQQAFQQSIQQIFFEEKIHESGWSVPKDAINRVIYPYFTDASGKYSVRLYNQTPESEKRELRESAEKSLVYSRYTDDVLGADIGLENERLYGTKISSKEAEFVTNLGKEKHAFTLIVWNASSIPDEEVIKYANDNKDKFIKYDYSAVTLDTKEEAETLLKQIQNNDVTFEDAVSERSGMQFIEESGKLASPYHYQLQLTIPQEEDLQSVLAINKGELSNVVQTQTGYSIFRKDGDAASPNFSDTDTFNVVSSYLKTNERGYIENYWINEARAGARVAFSEAETEDEENEGVAETEEEEEVKDYSVIKVPAFALNYANTSFFSGEPTDIQEITTLSTDKDALKTLFSLKKEQQSSPFVIGSNVIVAKCTGVEYDEEIDTSSYASQVSYVDARSSVSTLLASEDLDDQFYSTYFTYFLSGN